MINTITRLIKALTILFRPKINIDGVKVQPK